MIQSNFRVVAQPSQILQWHFLRSTIPSAAKFFVHRASAPVKFNAAKSPESRSRDGLGTSTHMSGQKARTVRGMKGMKVIWDYRIDVILPKDHDPDTEPCA